MKTLLFLKDFREYKQGTEKTFKSDHKADSILLVKGVAKVSGSSAKKAVYEDKMMTPDENKCEHCQKTYKSPSGLKRHITVKHK